jgi:uncharacterized protein YjgD (DUF1641 family)
MSPTPIKKYAKEDMEDKVELAVLSEKMERMESNQERMMKKVDEIHEKVFSHDGVTARVYNLEIWQSRINKASVWFGGTIFVAILGLVLKAFFK